jgi:hypothetical protein
MARLTLDNRVYKQLSSINDVLHQKAALVANDARRAAPSNTGYLKSKIFRVKTPTGARIKAEAHYSGYVEFTEQSFMRPALENDRALLIKSVRSRLRQIK